MIRFLLRIPKKLWERPERPRREVLVTLVSEGPDDLAELQFDGGEEDVRMVRDALLNWAGGERGAIIEADTTPAHLVVAMGGSVMKVFEPKLLEGGAIFQSPASALDEDLDRLSEVAATLFSDTLPLLPSFNDPASADLIERLRLILALFVGVCHMPRLPNDAGAILASLINKRLAAVGIDKEHLQQILQESCEFLEIILLDIPQTTRQVAEVLRRLVQFTTEPAETDLHTLCEELHAIWRFDSE
jgi:hypothetical protein